MGTVKLARVTSQLCCGDVDDDLSGEVMASYCLLPYDGYLPDRCEKSVYGSLKIFLNQPLYVFDKPYQA